MPKEALFDYWDALQRRLASQPCLSFGPPQGNYMHVRCDDLPKGTRFSCVALRPSSRLMVKLVLERDRAQALACFDRLQREKAQIETDAGQPLEWNREIERKWQWIAISKEGVSVEDSTTWESQHRWFKDNLLLMHRVFGRRVKGLG